ncbi:Glycogenin-1 [Gryllus bimaculatus]|nr:Glycogenin-1 [Gryllus bimaculatus]
MSDYSWVTLATNDTYSLGALVLARSLRRVSTNHNLTVMVTPGVSAAMRAQLASVFNVLEEVNILDSKDEKNLALLTRPELGITFTKLHCWRLTQFSKCVFLDADVMVLKNCDELFDREELSAAPDVGWPDCFNSGVFVYRPSIETYNALINFALSQGSFDGGDQGLLNQFFSDWATKDISRHLPFIYNMCSSATYSYLPAFKQFGQNVKIVHFIGTAKPWLQYLDSESRQVKPSPGSEHLQGFLQLWWDIFCNDVHSTLSSEMVHRSSRVSQLESSPMSHFVREICLNLEPKISLNQSKIPTPTYAHDPSDGYWDPWEMYQEPQDTIQTVNTGIQFISDQPYHTSGVSHSHHQDIPRCDTLSQSVVASEQNVLVGHSYQYSHEKQQSDLPPLSMKVYSSPTPHHNSKQSEEHVYHPSENQQEHSRSNYCVKFIGNDHRQEHLINDRVSNYTHTFKDNESGHMCSFEGNKAVEGHKSDVIQEHNSSPSTEVHSYNKFLSLDEKPKADFQSKPIESASFEHVSTVTSYPALLPDNKTLPDNSNISTSYDTECLSSPATTELENEDAGLAGALSQLTLGVARSPEQIALEEHLRKQAWEHGNIDYMNRDSFENIWRKICETLAEAPSADPLPEQRESTSQVSNVVVENISKEVNPGDDISLSESNTISVSSPHLQYTAASSPKSESQSDDATGVRSLPYLETSSGVQADQSSLFTHANDVSVPVTTSDLSTPECQDSSFNQKLVLQQGDTIPSSAIDICTESSPEVVQIASLQDPKLQLLATHQESNQATQIEEKDEIKTEQTVSQPSQDFSKSSGTVDALDSDTTAKSIPDIPHKQASVVSGGSKEPEVSIPHTTEETTVDCQLPSNVVQTQSEPQAYSAEVLGNAGELHTDFSEKTDSAVDLKSNIDSANQPESCPSSTSPSSEPLVDTSKVSVTAPTPPTSPTDNSTLVPPAPLATDTLSVEPSILPTPPVRSEPGGVVPMSDPVPATTVGSESPCTKADQSPDLILASADRSTSPSAAASQSADPICAFPDASGTPSLSVAQCPQPISSDPPSSSSPSESHDTSENTSQAVETKAPIPPKRRHKPSQNPDQSGSKSGKTPTKSPKGKK